MNLELSDDEQLLHDACFEIFRRYAGAERAREFYESGATDGALVRALDDAGMLDLARDERIGPVGAQLVTEWASEAAAVAPIGWRTLVAPFVIDGDVPPVVAVVWGGSGALCRFAGDADVLLTVERDSVTLVERGGWSSTAVESRYGYPLNEVEIHDGTALGPEAAETLARWSKVSLATEVAGAARAAIALTVQYVKDREQFGRALGSYQSIQHRLAENYMTVEALSLLAKEAAFHGAPAQRAAVAATFATDIAHRVVTDVHQFTGAMGFAKEYDLYLWSMRLEFLAREAGGLQADAEALFESRWGQGADVAGRTA